jgi:hypothetical protein
VRASGASKLVSDAAIRPGAAERRLPAEMPLNAITSVHGEAGPRGRLLLDHAVSRRSARAQFPDMTGREAPKRAGDCRQEHQDSPDPGNGSKGDDPGRSGIGPMSPGDGGKEPDSRCAEDEPRDGKPEQEEG